MNSANSGTHTSEKENMKIISKKKKKPDNKCSGSGKGEQKHTPHRFRSL
jgi:hypothetical protein